MRRWIRIGFMVLVLALVPIHTSHAAEAPAPAHILPEMYWDVTYWNNISLSGKAAYTGVDGMLLHDWGERAPREGVNADYFSARWTQAVDLEAGTYSFSMTSDDGVRLYVDERLVIDQWYDQASTTHVGEIALAAGRHRIVVEYYERTGSAVAILTWGSVPASVSGWRAVYHANPRLGSGCMPPVISTNCRAIVRDDPVIDFDWGYGAPMVEMPADRFSVRWTRTVTFEPGTYRFTTRTDDGVRLWVDNHLVIDRWIDQAVTAHVATVTVGGATPIAMDYYENGGIAAASLHWERVSGDPGPTDPLPETVVDDTDPGFTIGGAAAGWGTAAEGYNGHLTWTRNHAFTTPGYNWARWYPALQPGRYEVLVYIPDRYTTTARARYWISHQDGYALQVVDQSRHGGSWVSLGTYRFRGTANEYVSLADVTFEPHTSTLVGFDAVKWSLR
ncbi:MAG: hypothetical protein JXC32_19215 [Anaerolineae bacterium]|nr:hypothetical protein [Anaerolineae bacterium]